MVGNEPQGWYQDPFGLHEARYFSAGRPTMLVRDGNVESYDEPPAAGQPGPGPAAAPDPASGWALTRAEAGSPHPPGDGMPANGRPRPRAGLLATVAVIVIAAAVAAVMMVGKSGPATVKMSPAAFVVQSAQRTLSARTADLSISGSVSAAGMNMRISGTGQEDFGTNSMWLTVTTGMQGISVVEKEIEANGNLYLSLSENGKSMSRLTGGHDWVKLPIGQQSAAANLGGSDPASSLAALQQQGNTVRPLGTKVINGVTCTGYSVTVSTKAMAAAAKAEWAKLGLSNADASQALQAFSSMMQPVMTVWFDSQGLLRQMSMRLGMQLPGGSSNDSLGASMVMNFSNYGTQVHISAPPASDTTSYDSMLKGLGLGS